MILFSGVGPCNPRLNLSVFDGNVQGRSPIFVLWVQLRIVTGQSSVLQTHFMKSNLDHQSKAIELDCYDCFFRCWTPCSQSGLFKIVYVCMVYVCVYVCQMLSVKLCACAAVPVHTYYGTVICVEAVVPNII